MKRLLAFLLVLVLMVGLIGCSQTQEAQPEAQSEAEATSAAESGEAQETQSDGEGYKIALSNSFIGNGYRMQFVNTFVAYAEKRVADGTLSEYYQSSSGQDPQAQINEIRNMMSQGYDAILVNAASPTALIPVLEEAVERGITIVTVDNTVDSDLVYKVEVDGVSLGRNQAEWIVEKLDGEGNVVIIGGVEGTTIDRDRYEGQMEVLDQYPDINIIAHAYGDWDDATTMSVLNNILAANSGTQIDAIIQQGGGENGTYEALVKNGIDLSTCYVTGDMTNGLYRHFIEDGLMGVGVAHPPYCGATALDVAIAALNGENPDMYTPIPSPMADYTQAEEWYVEGYPDSAFVAYTNEGNTFDIEFADVAADK